MANFIYSLVTLLLALLIILAGFVCLLVFWSLDVRWSVIQFLQDDTFVLPLVGFTAIVVGCAMIVYFLLGTRRRYYTVKFPKGDVEIDQRVVKGYVQDYFRELFPGIEVPHQVLLKKGKVLIVVDLPSIPSEQREELIQQITTDLQRILRQVLGNTDRLQISLSFGD